MSRFHIIFESVDSQVARKEQIDIAALNDDRAQQIAHTIDAFVELFDFERCPDHNCITVTVAADEENALRRALQSHVDDYSHNPEDSAHVISFEMAVGD